MISNLSRRFVKSLVSRETILAAAIGIAASSASALAPMTCADVFQPTFWSRPKATVSRGGLQHLVSFSYDAEIPLGRVFELTKNQAGALEAFDQIMSPVSIRRLTRALAHANLTLASGLRADVSQSRAFYRLSELTPDAMSVLFERTPAIEIKDATPYVKTFLLPVLRRSGLAADAVAEGPTLRVRHISGLLSPEKFVSELRLVREVVRAKNIDYHLGLPEAAVSDRETQTLAQILRAHQILSRFEASRPLAADPVRVELQRFLVPYNAHDVELKSVANTNEGLSLLEFGARLAARRSDQLESPETHSQTQSVSAALNVFGHILRDTRLLALAGEMKAMDERLENTSTARAGELKARRDLESRVRSHLKRTRVLERAATQLLSGEGRPECKSDCSARG